MQPTTTPIRRPLRNLSQTPGADPVTEVALKSLFQFRIE
jgi:hypothetical protein